VARIRGVPNYAWNYALELDPAQPEDAATVRRVRGPLKPQPFTPDSAPVTLTVKARRLPAWQLEDNGLIQEVPPSPVVTNERLEQVTLIPMGCARLRVAAFPWIRPAPSR
jgi:hypothetical protein